MTIQNPYNDHIAFHSYKDVAATCKGLFEKTPVTYFAYQRLYSNGYITFLASEPGFPNYFLSDEVYQNAWYFSIPYCDIKSGVILWDLAKNFNSERQNALTSIISEEFGLVHGIDIIEKYGDYMDAYTFASSNVNIYLCNINYLKRFIFYFKQEIRKLIDKSWREKFFLMTLPPSITIPILTPEIQPDSDLDDSFKLNRYYLNIDSREIYLTSKELVCLKQLSLGYTAKEVAYMLNISPRTVELHTATLKEKLGCSFITEAICIAKQHNLI